MATISKFYLHDAATTNVGTMPGAGQPIKAVTGTDALSGDATGARTARTANGTIGTNNPDIESSLTSLADVNSQDWGHRRFVSPLLAAQTFAQANGTWTFSYARSESNLNHNQSVSCYIWLWRPTTSAQIGGRIGASQGAEPTVAATEQAESFALSMLTGESFSCLDGDVLVFDIASSFVQAMATAYTEQFAYDGTTEASTTACATFVTAPTPVTLLTAAGFTPAQRIVSQAVNRAGSY